MRPYRTPTRLPRILAVVTLTAWAAGVPALAGAQDVQRIDVAFAPEAGAESLVLTAIGAARSTIRLAAYSFTSAPVVRALVEARHRGVEVACVVDYKNNLAEDRSGKAKSALNTLVNAGIPVRIISRYPIHHDKFIVIDGLTVETGSFNYSAAAAHSNSENVVVIWNHPEVAARYLEHWQSRWQQGSDYTGSY